MNVAAIEVAAYKMLGNYVAGSETKLLADLAPFNAAAVEEVDSIAEKAFGNTPVVGGLIAAAIKSDNVAFQAALTGGERDVANFFIQFCNTQAAKLAA